MSAVTFLHKYYHILFRVKNLVQLYTTKYYFLYKHWRRGGGYRPHDNFFILIIFANNLSSFVIRVVT